MKLIQTKGKGDAAIVAEQPTLSERWSAVLGENKYKYPRYVITVAICINVLILLYSFVSLCFLFMGQWQQKVISVGPFASDGEWSIYISGIICLFSGYTFLFSTRVKAFKSKKARIYTFVLMSSVIVSQMLLWSVSTIAAYFHPFLSMGSLTAIEVEGIAISIEALDNPFESAIPFRANEFMVTAMAFPMILILLYAMKLRERFLEHGERIKESFFEFEWKGKLQQSISRLESSKQEDYFPDVEIGVNKKTGEMVVMPGQDRALHSVIVGSVGTGKTAALAEPILNQDLDHIAKYINDRVKLSEREDFHSSEVEGRYLNGISVIDPSNDLCRKMYKLVKVHNIPLEAVTYIDPQDPQTPSINPMKGPVDKVAEMFAQIMAGLSDSGEGNDFFEQAQRNHLKQYIYLLKLHDKSIEVDRTEATFDMLIDMYNNPEVAHQKHVLLQQRLRTELGVKNLSSAAISERINELAKPTESLYARLNQPDIDEAEKNEILERLGKVRDIQNYWKIFQGVDEWFRLNLVKNLTKPVKDLHGNVVELPREEWQDAKAIHVEGLRNQLNDISSNILIRRVLFGKSNFDFDRHLAMGGVLLVNTAKGQLAKLSSILGKIVLMNLQNASFRRPVKISPYHHILIDEAPDFLYKSFQEFPAQIRKYKVIVTTLQQTLAQLKGAFGEDYLNTLISTMRNRMVYTDVTGYDAKYFSEIFGEIQRFDEGTSEAAVSALQDDPSNRTSSTFTSKKEAVMTAGDILFQDKFECAVKLVVDNQPQPVQQIEANFIPEKLLEKAKVEADPKANEEWLKARRRFLEKWIEEKELEKLDNELESENLLQQLKEKDAEMSEESNPEHEQPGAAILPFANPNAPAATENKEPKGANTLSFDFVEEDNLAPGEEESMDPVVEEGPIGFAFLDNAEIIQDSSDNSDERK